MSKDEAVWHMSDVLRHETNRVIINATHGPGTDIYEMLWAVSNASNFAGLICGMGAGLGGPGRMEQLSRWYVQACRELASIDTT